MTTPARTLREINADVIAIRKELRRRGVAESVLDDIWRLKDEAFRRGCEYAESEEEESA